MKDYQSLNHTRWYCKYHIVFIPKKGKKLFMVKYAVILERYLENYQNKGIHK